MENLISPASTSEALPFERSGFGEIWTADVWRVGMWPQAKLTLSKKEIVVRVPKFTVKFSPNQVVEARMFRFPLPSLTIIFRDGDRHSLISFSVLRRSLLEKELKHCGVEITDHRTFRTGLEAGRDAVKYDLQSNGKRQMA